MATQVGSREQPLNVVLRPGSEAEAAYALAPGFPSRPSLDLQYLGGRTLARLRWTTVYLGRWSPADRRALDRAIPAAMVDPGLNDVVGQYFPGGRVESIQAGSQAGPVPGRTIDKPGVERIITTLGLSTLALLLLPHGTVLSDGDVTSEHGLGGYHGSVHVGAHRLYYAVAVYSEGGNGIVAFDEPWKNVCATVYHELQEARTDPDVEDAIRTGDRRSLGWYSPRGGEIGDIPIAESGGDIHSVMREVPLADGSGTVPIQLLWSNRVGGPEGPAAS